MSLFSHVVELPARRPAAVVRPHVVDEVRGHPEGHAALGAGVGGVAEEGQAT